jgi:two-component system chemotaxis response regulator CheB
MPKIRVLVVDDSALMRQLLRRILEHDAEIEVVGVASDPYVAWKKIASLAPDVVTLDVEMPRMDGLTFLGRLMQQHPLPVVMVSSLTQRGAETTLKALELGAIDFVTKPSFDIASSTFHMAQELIEKVKAAAQASLRPLRKRAIFHSGASRQVLSRAQGTAKYMAIGASTGGTQAIAQVLTALPADAPGIVMVQHMPSKFTQSFAQRLNSLCRIRVKEAQDGDRIVPGQALLAPGDFHMAVVRDGAHCAVRVYEAPPVNRFRPSVDVLFHSCAQELGASCVGAILTGMGCDGARGLLALRQAGGYTIAQDEATSVVFGMPREAIALNAAEAVLPLPAIAGALLNAARSGRVIA